LIRGLNGLNRQRGRKIKTEAEINGCSDNKRRFDWVRQALPFTPTLQYFGEFKPTTGIGLPEIDSGAQPIVVVFAGLELFARNQTFANLSVTAVVTKDKGAG